MNSPLDLLLIPFNETDTVCIPQNLVEYILPYAHALPSESNHRAEIGSLIYQNAKVPVLDLASLHNKDNKMVLPEISDGRYRIIILSSIHKDSYCENYAIIASNAPRLVSVTKENIEEIQSTVSQFFYSQIKILSEGAEQLTYIPNLEKVETTLFSGDSSN